jgi:hypothetical protein
MFNGKNKTAATCALLTIVVLLQACRKEQLPLRSECIVRAEISSVDPQRIEDSTLARIMPSASAARIPLAAYTVHGKTLYFQYQRNCGQRIDFTNALLSAANIHLAAPLSTQPVAPSTKTIAVTGPAWRD